MGPLIIIIGIGRCNSPVIRNFSETVTPSTSCEKNTNENTSQVTCLHLDERAGSYMNQATIAPYDAGMSISIQPPPLMNRSRISIGLSTFTCTNASNTAVAMNTEMERTVRLDKRIFIYLFMIGQI